MTKKSAPANPQAIVKLISEIGEDPEKFDSVIEEWNTLFELSSGQVERSFADVDVEAFNRSGEPSEHARHSAVGRKVADMLETFESPAYLVRENGKILTQNKAALEAFNLGAEASLDDLPLDLESDAPLADVIRDSLKPSRNSSEAMLKRAFARSNDSPLTLSITPSKPLINGQGEALVFVVDARWKTAAAGLIKREFDLTNSERELLEAFLDGQTTQEMANQRKRSHATIRTQFHSLMTKMGARSQTELFRNALSVSQFVDKIDEIAEVLRHPHRKRVDLMRPGGRSVEITLSGDLSGKPYVFIQSSANYTFERKIEQVFHDAGICMLSICQPGCGDTDPPLEGAPAQETMAQDISAVLDQLGHDKCILMTSNLTSPFLYRVSRYLPHRLHGLVQIAGPIPQSYCKADDDVLPWSKGLTRAVQTNQAMADFIIGKGVPIWIKMGPKAFINIQFRKNRALQERLTQPETFTELIRAFEVTTAQGPEVLKQELKTSFQDFVDDIKATDAPILQVHGSQDEYFPIKAARAFAEAFAPRVTLMEIPDAGFGPLDTHAREIVDQMIAFAQSCER